MNSALERGICVENQNTSIFFETTSPRNEVSVSHKLTFLSPVLRRLDPRGHDDVVAKSHRFDGGFLAHNAWRKRVGEEAFGKLFSRDFGEIPYTGCERFFEGFGLSIDEILHEEAVIGRRIMEGVDRVSRVNPYFRGDPDLTRRSMLQTARGEAFHLPALSGLNAFFGAEMARLRALRSRSPDAERVIVETDKLVEGLGQVEYAYDTAGIAISDTYRLPQVSVAQPETKSIELSKPEYNGIVFLEQVGRIGHPLIRQLLRTEIPS